MGPNKQCHSNSCRPARWNRPCFTASSARLLEILKMEEGHVDWAEIQRAQIAQMGVENYLANQTGGAAG
jgi:hypothetical protein